MADPEATIAQRIEAIKLLGVLGRAWQFTSLQGPTASPSPSAPHNPDVQQIAPEFAAFMGDTSKKEKL